MYSEIKCEKAFAAALQLARGSYQEAILYGSEALSGGTLRGKAKEYSGRYCRSAQNLLSRMTAAGIPWSEKRGKYGKRILVIGA